VDEGLYLGRRLPQGQSNLPMREPVKLSKHQRRPLFLTQPGQESMDAPLLRQALRSVAGVFVPAGPVARVQRDQTSVLHPAGTPSQDVQANVRGDAGHPGLQVVAVEPWKPLEYAQHSLLGRFLGVVEIAEQAATDPIHQRSVSPVDVWVCRRISFMEG
jgi:hypothetical protein